MKIHFICRGNSFRSRIAEAYLNSLHKDVRVISSGTVADKYRAENDPISKPAEYVLKKNKIFGFAKMRADQLNQSRIDPNDITICMNQRVYDESKALVSMPKNVQVWAVDDIEEHFQVPPSEEESNMYADQVFESIKKKVDELLKQLNLLKII